VPCHCYTMMDEIMFKLDSLRLLPLILEERKELDWAQERLRKDIPHPLECIRESKLFLMKELSSFLDLVISERVVEPQGEFSYTWELWEYVDAIELCDQPQSTRISPRISLSETTNLLSEEGKGWYRRRKTLTLRLKDDSEWKPRGLL
jgi:hypothetical protein